MTLKLLLLVIFYNYHSVKYAWSQSLTELEMKMTNGSDGFLNSYWMIVLNLFANQIIAYRKSANQSLSLKATIWKSTSGCDENQHFARFPKEAVCCRDDQQIVIVTIVNPNIHSANVSLPIRTCFEYSQSRERIAPTPRCVCDEGLDLI